MGPRLRGDDSRVKEFTSANEERAPLLWGPLTRFALAVALVAAAIDQAAKLWLLFVFDLGARGIVTLTPFLDLVLTWNTGISYGLAEKFVRVGRPFCVGHHRHKILGFLGCGELISIRRRRVTTPPTEDSNSWVPGQYWPSALSRRSARPRYSQDRRDSPGRCTGSLHS